MFYDSIGYGNNDRSRYRCRTGHHCWLSAGCAELHPDALVDAILAKKNLGTHITDAPIVIAVGPGFTAGVDRGGNKNRHDRPAAIRAFRCDLHLRRRRCELFGRDGRHHRVRWGKTHENHHRRLSARSAAGWRTYMSRNPLALRRTPPRRGKSRRAAVSRCSWTRRPRA